MGVEDCGFDVDGSAGDDDDGDGADKDVAIFAGEVSAPSSDGCCRCGILGCSRGVGNRV